MLTFSVQWNFQIFQKSAIGPLCNKINVCLQSHTLLLFQRASSFRKTSELNRASGETFPFLIKLIKFSRNSMGKE